MERYDLMILGPATRDENIDYTGQVDRCVGGAVTFCAPAAAATGARVFAAVAAAEGDDALMDQVTVPGGDKALIPSGRTTIMRNEYFTPDRERRRSSCAAQSDPIRPDMLPQGIAWDMAHLAGLLYGDFPNALIETLRSRGRLTADAQGFLRHNENGSMVFSDWTDKRTYLPYFDILKTDAAEAEILTGCADRAEAARQMHAWGVPEVLISHNAEMLVYDGREMYTCPVKARNLSGRTGRGDTVFGAYIAMRVKGADIEDALLYATACVSLKMETPGAFRGTRADVEE
ncbi:MAG: ribokinase, partial [Clostridiales bacterium]|nr:ribokinase [Clostridiales bacterium]